MNKPYYERSLVLLFLFIRYMRNVAILVAAGLSSRMGGPNKLLMDIGRGLTLIQHSLQQLLASSIDEVVVVTGRDASTLHSEISKIQNSKSKIAYNSNFEQGMTTSIQAGLREVNNADAVMICLSDMPKLTATNYNELIDAFEAKGGRNKILAPFNGDKKGNPVLFGSDYFYAIATHKQIDGCAEVVKKNQSQLIRFETENKAYFFDIDTQESLRAYKESVK